MTLTIEQLEAQVAELQKNIEILKEQKLEVTREFIGQYFAPFKGQQYRRMESEEVPIWECFSDSKKIWILLNKQESEQMERLFKKD
jgi:hypothetical protein